MRRLPLLLTALGGCLALLWATGVLLLTRQGLLLLALMTGTALASGALTLHGWKQKKTLTALLTLCVFGLSLLLGLLVVMDVLHLPTP